MAMDTQRGVPGIPVSALDAIQDQNTKLVLRSIVDGWHVRNGTSGKGDNAFVTKQEVAKLSGEVGGLRNSVLNLAESASSTKLKPGEISRIINDLQAQVIESQLFKELGERIDALDLGIITEQNARIAAVQSVADDLAAEAQTRLGFDTAQGAQIATLQTTTATQATQITGLTTRIGSAESTIVGLQSTTATQATALTSLTTRVGAAESGITSLQQTTATQASSLTALTTRVGTAESSISTLNTTTANQATSLTSLGTRVGTVETGLTNEITARANADNAITTTVNTQFATVNTSIAALQTKQTTTANNVAALTSTVSTLQATTGSNTLAIQTEATARVNADNDIYGKYGVKIDNNGYVTGFGLISTANNSTPFSEFLVRADRFAIASPSGPGISPAAPFIVTTTPDGAGNPPGVYIKSAFIGNATIDSAKIGDAAVNTLKIAGNAVTVPVYASAARGVTLFLPTPITLMTMPFTIDGLDFGEQAGVIVNTVVSMYPTDGAYVTMELIIEINGVKVGAAGASIKADGFSHTATGFGYVPNGTHTIAIKLRTSPESGGGSSKNLITVAYATATAGKR